MWIWLFLIFAFQSATPATAGDMANPCVQRPDHDGYPLGEQEDQFIEQMLIKVQETFDEKSEQRKKDFLTELTPAVVRVMSRVETERDFLAEYVAKKWVRKGSKLVKREDGGIPADRPVSARQQERIKSLECQDEASCLEALMKRYHVKGDEEKKDDAKKDEAEAELLEELSLRVNVVPLDLVLAQAAEESGWGTSKIAKNCYNYFGIHKAEGMATCRTPSKLLAKFSSPEKGIEFYVLNLNRNDAYERFREERQRLLNKKVPLTGKVLVGTLTAYSTKRGAYPKKVNKLMNSNGLTGMVKGAIEQTKPVALPPVHLKVP